MELQGSEVDEIGIAAGLVWNYLTEKGPVTLSKLSREIDAPRDLVMQGVGWLARESKIEFHPGPRSKLVSLKTD
ncbi:hypothetical protein Pla110_25520 [Polystyrenella longa]|uniref:Winged helix-turn-helix domain-containing protein n=1 Tax=Polystyrenella longa TaxID=2528007 RepID=A0A518CNL7_9PLAN|nr:winged helix-turn-helix domain-containing protein [Polystyrenella longa]QDU80817.1 hypothetical protein Pla110_25520 [Polystyrenella longa]